MTIGATGVKRSIELQKQTNKIKIMNTETLSIEAGNKLIAGFMGVKPGVDKYSWRIGCFEPLQEYHLNYHKEWGWLMPVVEKIERIQHDHHGYFGVHISSNGCTIQATKFRSNEPMKDPPHYLADYAMDTKIEAVWQAVVQFIQWYNNQNQNKS